MFEFSSYPPVIRVLSAIYAFMALCSLSGALHPKLRSPAGKPIRQAINSWWPPAIAGGIAVAGGGWVGVAVFTGISLWTLHEYLRLLPAGARNRGIETLTYLVVPLHYGMLVKDSTPFAAGLAAWTFGFLPLAWLFTAGPQGTLTILPRIQWGIVLTVMALSYVARLFVMDDDAASGAGLACLLLVAIMVNDAAQYVFGKLLGRHSLAPRLSPRKTWEGLAGGIVTTATVSAIAGPLLAPFGVLHSALIGAALSIFGLLGDLLISGIKRDAGVKDTGAVLPQHGGVLDRCDSLLLAAPVFYYGVQPWLI